MSKNFFLSIGILLFIWWFFDLILKLRFYQEYDFLWFCSISLLVLSLGFILKSPALMISFLSVALIAQIDWTLDFFSYILFSKALTGNASYVFDYGHTPLEFFNSLRHLFMIPLTLLGLKYIKKTSKKSWFVTLVFITILGIASFVLGMPEENLNCVFKPCWPIPFSMPPFLNFIATLIFFILVSVFFLNFLINKFLEKVHKERKYKKIFNKIIIVFFVIAVSGVFLGSLVYIRIPHYICKNQKGEIFCEGAYSYGKDVEVSYHIKSDEKKNCRIELYSQERVLAKENISIEKGTTKGYIIIPIPKKNTDIYLKANCSKNI